MTNNDGYQGGPKESESLLTEAITILCKSRLTYTVEFSLEWLLVRTLHNDKVFLISINEKIRGDFSGGQGITPTLVKAMTLMMLQREDMSAPAKPMDRGWGMPGGRGRAPLLNIKCFTEEDFKQGTMRGSNPRISIHPGTPGTSQ